MHFSKNEHINVNITKNIAQAALRIQDLFVAFLELYSPAKDRDNPPDFDSRAEMPVRVWKGGFMLKPL